MVDAEDLVGSESLGGALQRLRAAVRPDREVPGFATVDRARCEATLTGGIARPASVPDTLDPVLGAFARRIEMADGTEVAVLEPSSEGRLAAALARHGEGVLVLYLLADAGAAGRARAAGFALGRSGNGPFGPERLVFGGPHRGPFLILATAD